MPYIGSLGNVMDGSGRIQLIYPGSTTSDHILDGGCFDKAIRAHLLSDAALCQYVMKDTITEEELREIRTFVEEVACGKLGAKHTSPIVAVFELRFEETYKSISNGGSMPARWVQYHGLCPKDLDQI